jgi:FixJ family two-component response regulator
MTAQSTVLIVDDDPAVRRSLQRLVESADLRAETFASAEDFLGGVLPEGPTCLLLDVQMPGLSGPDLQERLARAHHRIPIIFITGHGTIPMSVRAMKAGAADFFAKPVDGETLLAAIESAIARDQSERRRDYEIEGIRARLGSLTARQRQVLELVVRGHLNKQVAHTLGLSEKTVKVHRAHVMEKMGVRSLAELVRLTDKADFAAANEPAFASASAKRHAEPREHREPWRRPDVAVSARASSTDPEESPRFQRPSSDRRSSADAVILR